MQIFSTISIIEILLLTIQKNAQNEFFLLLIIITNILYNLNTKKYLVDGFLMCVLKAV